MEINKTKKYTINTPLEYIVGYLKSGHIEMILDESEFYKFIAMNSAEQKDYLKNNGNLIIDEYKIENYLPSGDISIHVND